MTINTEMKVRVARVTQVADKVKRFRFERAVSLDPQNASALNNLAVACEQMGEFDKAREAGTASGRLATRCR